jgi:hypothetical protein
MASSTKPARENDKLETDEVHEECVATVHARLDAERELKRKVREEERACFEETARILGHKPSSNEQVKATARRREANARIAKLGERAGFIGEAFADEHDEVSTFAGGQIMGGTWPWGGTPYDLVSNPPIQFYPSTVFQPPYRFKVEYPDYVESALPNRGADRRTGKVFAKGSSHNDYDGHLGAAVGVRFSLPINPLAAPIPRLSGPPIPPPYQAFKARIVTSVEGTKFWRFYAESFPGLCRGDFWFFPIWAHPLYDQGPNDLTGEWPTLSTTRWKVRTIYPPDYDFPDPYHWIVNRGLLAPRALPSTIVSPWFTVDNYHSYDIYVGVRVETEGTWMPDYGWYSEAIAEMEAVIHSITIQYTG